MTFGIASIETAIEDIKNGKMIILVDDENRENEGDLLIAADKISPEAINFMVTHARGLVCLAMTNQRADELNLPLMVTDNHSRFHTAFTISIEAKEGVTTGISAFDRSNTIATAVDPSKEATDIVSPGHIFPLRANDDGVLSRQGQTEGAVDLARLAGCIPAGVICEIMNDDGTMARMPDLIKFANKHSINIATIADLVEYRQKTE